MKHWSDLVLILALLALLPCSIVTEGFEPTSTPTPTATMTPVPTYTPTATATPELVAVPPVGEFANILGLWLGEPFRYLPWVYTRAREKTFVFEKDRHPGVLYDATFIWGGDNVGWVVGGVSLHQTPVPTRGQEVHNEEHGLHSEDDGT